MGGKPVNAGRTGSGMRAQTVPRSGPIHRAVGRMQVAKAEASAASRKKQTVIWS